MSGATQEPLGAGAIVAGYRIERTIGRGGMGVVYLATDLGLQRSVALKVIAPTLSSDPRIKERFVHESRLAASIDHPSIVPIFGSGDEDGRLWIAMRFVDGLDLRSLIAERGPLDAPYASGILAQVAKALDAAHARGLVHRDVKPSNILIEPELGGPIGASGDHAYLTDFGLSRRASDLTTAASEHEVLGTVDYLSPEQIEGGVVDGRADQYALAATLYASLAGEPPFERDSDLATMYSHVRQPPPSLARARPDLPIAVDDVLSRGMAKRPDDRFPSVSALIERFEAALEGPATPATGPPAIVDGGAHPPNRHGRRRAGLLVGTAALVFAVVVAGVFVAIHRNPGGPHHAPGAASAAVLEVSVSGQPHGQIVSGLEEAHASEFSPTGDRIAYVATIAGTRHLFVKRLGEPGRGIEIGEAPDAHAQDWSPDGTKIAVVALLNGRSHVFIDDADGSGEVPLPATPDISEASPGWSPDGQWIAWVRETETAGHHVIITSADGSTNRDLTPPGRDDQMPAWSPTADRLLVSRAQGDGRAICHLSIDASPHGCATEGAYVDTWPTWSPDGSTFVFVRTFPGNAEIFKIAPEHVKVNLTNSPANQLQPRWSPDGRHIAFVTSVGDRSHVFVMDSGGSGIRQLTTGAVRDVWPVWLDDSTIVFSRTPAV